MVNHGYQWRRQDSPVSMKLKSIHVHSRSTRDNYTERVVLEAVTCGHQSVDATLSYRLHLVICKCCIMNEFHLLHESQRLPLKPPALRPFNILRVVSCLRTSNYLPSAPPIRTGCTTSGAWQLASCKFGWHAAALLCCSHTVAERSTESV